MIEINMFLPLQSVTSHVQQTLTRTNTNTNTPTPTPTPTIPTETKVTKYMIKLPHSY